MSEAAVASPSQAEAVPEAGEFDFAEEFKRRLEAAPDYQGPEREIVTRGLEAVGISEVRKLVPAFMFERRYNGEDSNGYAVRSYKRDVFIGDVEELKGKMDPYHFGIVREVNYGGYVLTDGAGESYFLMTDKDGVVAMFNDLQDWNPRANDSYTRVYKELLERYGLKAFVRKADDPYKGDFGEWGGEAGILVDDTPLPPVLSEAEKHMFDNGGLVANVATGYIKQHYPEATNTEVIRFVSIVRSLVEAGMPLDYKKILEELKAQKEQELG